MTAALSPATWQCAYCDLFPCPSTPRRIPLTGRLAQGPTSFWRPTKIITLVFLLWSRILWPVAASSSSYNAANDPRYYNDRQRPPLVDDEHNIDNVPTDRPYYYPGERDQASALPRQPPPPPSPPSTAAYAQAPPLHYQFQRKDLRPPPSSSSTGTFHNRNDLAEFPDNVDEEDNIPTTVLEKDATSSALSTESLPQYTSARRDVITVYMDRSVWHRWMVRGAAGGVGAAVTTFLGTSLTSRAWWTVYAWLGFVTWCTTAWWMRNPYGELARTAGYVLIRTIQETRHVRKEYPTRPHVRALLGAGPRRPFPPTANPWNYRPSADDVPFSMLYACLAMTLVGSFCGGNIPMVPSWLGGLVGAGFLGLLTTRPSARGDLARATGMRVVATVQTLWSLQADVHLTAKFWRVTSLVLDKLLILDRQHRLKDRLVAFLTLMYDQIRKLVQQFQQERTNTPPSRTRPSGDDNDRRPPRRRGGMDAPIDRPRGPPGRRPPSSRYPEQDDRNRQGGFDQDLEERTMREEEDGLAGTAEYHKRSVEDASLREEPPEEPRRRRGWFR